MAAVGDGARIKLLRVVGPHRPLRSLASKSNHYASWMGRKHPIGASSRQRLRISRSHASLSSPSHASDKSLRAFVREFSSPAPNSQHYDVVIAGGGVVGSVLARLLLDDAFEAAGDGNDLHRRPLKLALLEQRSSPSSLKDLANGNSATPHPRAYALSPTSLSYLGPSVLQSLVRHNQCGIFDAMQIWEHDGPAQLHFVGEDLEGAVEEGRLVDLNRVLAMSTDDADRKRPWLGALVEDAPLVSYLWDELRNDDRIDLLDNLQIASIQAPPANAMGNIAPPPPVQLSFTRSKGNDQGGTLTADLLVGADGANSLVRRTVGTFPMMTRSYGRKAVTCTVELESGMAQTAFQRFLPHGPIALLPVWNGQDTDEPKKNDSKRPVYANVVWSTTPSEANYLLSLSPSEFTSILNKHLRQGPNVNKLFLAGSDQAIPSIQLLTTVAKEIDSLLRTANTALTMGTWTESPSRNYFRMPPKSVGVVSPILGFDLAMSHVVASGHDSKALYGGYTSPRVALVGDAAHTMHPMAGQGLNLGLGDAHSLSRLIKEAVDSGMNIGGTSLILDRYNNERLLKGWGTVGGVHCLHEIFGCSHSIPGSVADDNYDGSKGTAGGFHGLIKYSRSLGMNVVNGMPLVRRTLAEVAAGATLKGFREPT